MQIFSVADVAALAMKQTGRAITVDAVGAQCRRRGLGTVKGSTRILTASEVEKLLAIIATSKVGNPQFGEGQPKHFRSPGRPKTTAKPKRQ